MGRELGIGAMGNLDPDAQLFRREWVPLKDLAYLLTRSEPAAEEV